MVGWLQSESINFTSFRSYEALIRFLINTSLFKVQWES